MKQCNQCQKELKEGKGFENYVNLGSQGFWCATCWNNHVKKVNGGYVNNASGPQAIDLLQV